MLDLMTLVSSMGVQQELSDRTKEQRAISDAETEEDLVSQAADQLSSAFEAFEDGLSSLFSSEEPAQPANTQKVVE